MQVRGVVKATPYNEWQGKKLYSIQLDGDRTYYNTGTNVPRVQPGDYVTFEAEVGQNGRTKADLKTLRVENNGAPPPPSGRTAAAVAKSAGMSKDDYWTRREERDLETQKRIERQSCRNSAIELVDLLIRNEALTLGAKAKKADVIVAAVDEYTEYYLNANSGAATVAAEVDTKTTESDEPTEDEGDWS